MKNIKYFLIIPFLVGLILPSFSSAITLEELQAQINALLNKIAQLQELLDQIKGTPPQWCYTFTNNFGIGSKNKRDIDALRIALQKEGFSVEPANYFNESMAAAVSGFQQKYANEILKPAGLRHPTGYVGKYTRAKLNSLYGCKNRPVTITSLRPTSGPVNTNVTITGSGFTATGNRVKFGDLGTENNPRLGLDSPDGRTLVFTVPSEYSPPCPPRLVCLPVMHPTQPGTYNVSVINANGTSNEVPFTVTSPPLSITTTSLPDGRVRVSYSAQISASGGDHSYMWSVSSGALPPGLELDPLICVGILCQAPLRIIGTPTTTGSYTFTITVKSGTLSASKEFTITINPLIGRPVTITSLQPNSGPVGTKVTITGSGFTPMGNRVKFGDLGTENILQYNLNSHDSKTLVFTVPYYYSPPCPPGLVCPDVWHPTQPGIYNVSVINANGTSNEVPFTVTLPPLSITTTALPGGIVGMNYSAQISASGGDHSYVWNVPRGTFPPGLKLDFPICLDDPCQAPLGIRGIPTTAGSYTFTITVKSGTLSASKEFTIFINRIDRPFR